MPCCAFAAYLISQLVVALAALRQFVFRSSARRAAAGVSTEVVEWRLGADPTPAWRRRRAWGWDLAIAAVIEVALLAGTVYSARAHFSHADTVTRNASHAFAHGERH